MIKLNAEERRDVAVAAIEDERTYQYCMWSGLDKENLLPDYLTYIHKYYLFAETANAVRLITCLDNIRKITALGFAAMEKCGWVRRGDDVISKAVIPPPMGVGVDAVLPAILEERDYQDALGPDRCEAQGQGNTIDKNPMTVGCYLTMFRYYIAECDKAWTNNPGDLQALDQLRKLTALGFRCLEEYAGRGYPIGRKDIAHLRQSVGG